MYSIDIDKELKMKSIDGIYNRKQKFKYAFVSLTNPLDWFLANKKPKHIKIKTGYFGNNLATHRQYRINHFAYDYVDRNWDECKYTEHEFVSVMIKYCSDQMRINKKRYKIDSETKRFLDNYNEFKLQREFFKKRLNEIENTPDYIMEVLTK